MIAGRLVAISCNQGSQWLVHLECLRESLDCCDGLSRNIGARNGELHVSGFVQNGRNILEVEGMDCWEILVYPTEDVVVQVPGLVEVSLTACVLVLGTPLERLCQVVPIRLHRWLVSHHLWRAIWLLRCNLGSMQVRAHHFEQLLRARFSSGACRQDSIELCMQGQ